MSVFVLDQSGKPLMPCTEKRARLLLERGRARIHRLMPLVIRLVDRSAGSCVFQPLALKIDPGSQSTGIALARPIDGKVHSVMLTELAHRADHISLLLHKRKLLRHARRSRHGRYRRRRIAHLTTGLPPSLRHRLQTIETWVRRLRAWAPVNSIVWESVGFDAPPDLVRPVAERGMHLRDRLKVRWGARCAYCGEPGPFQADHVQPKARLGSNRISNRALSCVQCNANKGKLRLDEFLEGHPERIAKVKAWGKESLRDLAAVNSIRRELERLIAATGLPVEMANTRHTKTNRNRFGLAKRDAIDALALGRDVAAVFGADRPVLCIKAMGRGSHQRTRTDAAGFPTSYLRRMKRVHGFATGDLVRAVVRKGKRPGVYVGRVAVRFRGAFNLHVQGLGIVRVAATNCDLLQRGDGYAYAIEFT